MRPSSPVHAIEAGPLAQGTLCCRASHRFSSPSDIPPPITDILPVSADLIPAYHRRNTAGYGGTFRFYLRHLSPHAVSLTPGPPPVHLPFASRRALAFPINVEGRRVSPLRGFGPATGLSQL